MVKVVDLISYPIKGCAGIPLTESLLTPAGLAYDRSFMVVSEDGVFRSQRREPLLAVVRPEISADGERLTLNAPGMTPLRIAVDSHSAPRAVEMFDKPYRGIDQGPDAAAWFSELLGAPSRLVRVPRDHGRVTDGWIPGTAGYADSGALLVLSRASMDELDRRLRAAGSPSLPMDRFRPNVVVDTRSADPVELAEPHWEDRARRVLAGNAELGYLKLAVRCAVTMVDQTRGVKAGPEPLRTLAHYRRTAAGGIVFGTKFSVVRPGKLAVGDEVTVTEWGASEA
ncbi:MOSC N-terminal beta barrel domain-containing protein [Streptomyces sp. LX-29]|uniref:MOSC domain-containing protein n=1 Tax=Streptomyces sp. LX-29 TaxID=2900152 RepID=UPI00240E00FC|nr:MOSC N-terminal beta barrel domain-containing protein [Streptomyces sp. LX-29]WFB09342.1 MOSC N-terminal beta barrel domain-containing protein [Streptomyces sp. LX-29]